MRQRCAIRPMCSVLPRRTTLLLGAMLITLIVVSGVALAATIDCLEGMYDGCRGTEEDDTMNGTPTNDEMFAGYGDDLMYGRGSAVSF